MAVWLLFPFRACAADPNLPLCRDPAWRQGVAQLRRYQNYGDVPPPALRLDARGTVSLTRAAVPPYASLPASGPAPGPITNRAAAFSGPDWAAIIERAGRNSGVDAALLTAVIHAESGFDARAVSPKGALGAMQIMPETGRELGLVDFFDPAANTEAGARYLSAMLRRFGDLDRSLAAYNAGPGAVRRFGGVPPFPETRDFIARVLELYEKPLPPSAHSGK